MKKIVIVFGLLLMQCGLISAQYVVKSQEELVQLQQLPLEKM